jgi:hypothetical protein
MAGHLGPGTSLSGKRVNQELADLSWRDHEYALAGNRDEDMFVPCVCRNGMAPQGNGSEKLLRGRTYHGQF